MVAEDLINAMIPPLKPTDTTQQALNWMDKLKINQLPIVDKGVFIGIISENDILDTKASASTIIKDIPLSIQDAEIKPMQHFYDVLKIASKTNSKLLAVLTDEKEYLGVIPVKDTLNFFNQMSAMNGPGAIIVLSMDERNYSLAQISRLIEENDVKILSVLVAPEMPNSNKIRVTIKTNSSEISRVVATLERFEFSIVAQFQGEELLKNDSNRLDMLFRYLNI